MLISPPVAGVRRLAATLYAYAFFDDLVLLYPVYALLFVDTGLSDWQISSLFVIWCLASVALEVPSGALADVLSRRLLLWVGQLLSALGFALWVFAPSYWAFALGFVLWGISGSLASGALEALTYEELERRGAADQYARIQGRAEVASAFAVVLATAGAGPVLDAWGYPAVGVASVLACLVPAAVAASLPEGRRAAGDDTPELGYVETLRAGLAEVRADAGVRRALLLVPAVTAVWGALDEYTPLLARSTGVAAETVPLLLLLLWAAVTVGGLLAGRASQLSATGLATLLAAAALALAIGAASGRPVGMVLVAVAFGAFQVATVVADARLQERITGPSRATVTSLSSLGTDVTTIAVYVTYAGLAPAGHGLAFAAFALPYLFTAAWLRRRRPSRVCE